jgi:hypothetical protein
VSAVRDEPVDAVRVRLLLRCGQCQTWRAFVLALDAADALRRALDRDRRRIAHALRRVERGAVAHELHVSRVDPWPGVIEAQRAGAPRERRPA